MALSACGGGGASSSGSSTPAVAPTIASQPGDVSVEAGQAATFTVSAGSGTAPIAYQWSRNGAAISGATGISYTTPNTVAADNGATFTVALSNSAGSVTSAPAVLRVSSIPLPPAITTQPADATVSAGATATFAVSAASTSAASYQWLRNGLAVSGATASSYTTPATAAADDGALFSVLVTNAAGTTASAAATLHVNAAPLITTQPQSAVSFTGQSLTFTVIAAGTAPLAYQWRRNGTAISGATSASYRLDTLVLGDNGAVFSVVVSNAVGSTPSANATLTVTAPPALPAIATQPQSLTVLAGRTATFGVVASSSTALTYQWRKNGTAIAGATSSSYTTGTLAYTESGDAYSVVVSNKGGSTASNNAVLTVNPRVVQVGVGSDLGSARKEDGTVWNWGWSRYLGADGSLVPYGTMVRAMNVDGTLFNGVTTFSTGLGHTLALKADGSLWAWGDNSQGSIGDGRRGSADAYYPTRVLASAGVPLTGVVAVSGGWRASLALKSDGTVWGWGYARALGNNNTGGPSYFVYPVSTQDTNGGQLGNVVQVSSTNDHAVALKSDGTVWIWGNGQGGMLGDGNNNSFAYVAQRLNDSNGVPISGVVNVSAGHDHSVLVKADGTAYAWGYNNYGQLSDGSTTGRTWAVIVKNAAGNPFTGIATALAGDGCTLFLKTDGTVWMVGRNAWGQLGNGSTAAYSTVPVQVTFSDGTPLTGVKQVALFDLTVVVLRTDDTVWAWGDNAVGELGYAPTNAVQLSRYPVKVSVTGD